MKKLYLVTLRFADRETINAIKMIREFFHCSLSEAKNAVEQLLIENPEGGDVEVKIAVSAEEYANFWIVARPGMFGRCRVMNIENFVMPKFYRPGDV